jgi:NAD(P)-dependent dehydrogenase (short-subunit alcohol dehydrogenase family)
MAGRLAGKVALITGAASGIGAASARLFAAEGAQVALGDRNQAGLNDVGLDIHHAGGEALTFETNVGDAAQIEQLVEATIAQFGRLDILFANAGIGGSGTVVDIPIEDFERVLDINLRGPFLCARYAIPHIAAAGGGSVIFTASELALVGSPGSPAYCASKAGLIGMARAMALDHAPQGIRVNCLCPGATDTPMLRASFERADDPVADEADVVRRMPLGRLGTVEELARAALFLASEDASFITGTALVVDGGWTAR